MINRRKMLVVLAGMSTLPLLGVKSCEQQQNTLVMLTETLGNAVANLAQIAGNATLAAQLREHTNTAVSLLRGWKPGQSAIDIIRALNRIIDDLNLFPALDKYRPLITFVLGTIAAIIEQIQQSGGGGESAHTKVRIPAPPKDSHEFRVYWDAIRASSPGMEQVPVL